MTKIWKCCLKFLENKSKYFSKIFLQTILKFSQNFRVLGVSKFKKKKKYKNRLTDRPYLAVRSPVKQGIFFSWPKGPFTLALHCGANISITFCCNSSHFKLKGINSIWSCRNHYVVSAVWQCNNTMLVWINLHKGGWCLMQTKI